MKFLILGCNGMAGHMISLYLKKCGYEVIGFARNKSKIISTIIGDATENGVLKKNIMEGGYDCIVNCIGLLNRNAEEEKDKAVYLNAYLPHFLAKVTSNTRTQVIHISTDCVFSGKRGSYRDDDFKDGESFYDRSKALGEIANSKDFTIRTSIVGPELKANGIGLLNWFMHQNKSVRGYANVMWSGLTTLQLAKCIETISVNKLCGLHNITNNESISKYELLMLFNELIRKDKIEIKAVNEPVLDKTLISDMEELSIPGYRDMVEDMARIMNDYRDLYTHYKIAGM